MSNQLLVEKTDGYLLNVYADQIVDVVPSAEPDRQPCAIVMRYGDPVLLSEETNVIQIIEWWIENLEESRTRDTPMGRVERMGAGSSGCA
tara:strand:- start:3520 stop:3789 length:270 start_codon:yes stop_codon:yes gene_type:complete